VELDGTDLKMKVNVFSGYDYDVSVNCYSVDGSLVMSKAGVVYKKSDLKVVHGNTITAGVYNSVDACLKLCEDTTDCILINFRISDTYCQLKS
jgi:hypothetical protein